MATALQSSRLLVREAAHMIDEDHPAKATMCAMAKLQATEASFKVNAVRNLGMAYVFCRAPASFLQWFSEYRSGQE